MIFVASHWCSKFFGCFIFNVFKLKYAWLVFNNLKFFIYSWHKHQKQKSKDKWQIGMKICTIYYKYYWYKMNMHFVVNSSHKQSIHKEKDFKTFVTIWKTSISLKVEKKEQQNKFCVEVAGVKRSGQSKEQSYTHIFCDTLICSQSTKLKGTHKIYH